MFLSQYFNALSARRLKYDKKVHFVKWSKNRKYGLNAFTWGGHFVVQINTLGAVNL